VIDALTTNLLLANFSKAIHFGRIVSFLDRQLYQGESFYDVPFQQMLLDYLDNIIWPNLRVPDTFRINQNSGANRTKTDRTTVSKYDLSLRISTF